MVSAGSSVKGEVLFVTTDKRAGRLDRGFGASEAMQSAKTRASSGATYGETVL
jgi:hypothetical protein